MKMQSKKITVILLTCFAILFLGLLLFMLIFREPAESSKRPPEGITFEEPDFFTNLNIIKDKALGNVSQALSRPNKKITNQAAEYFSSLASKNESSNTISSASAVKNSGAFEITLPSKFTHDDILGLLDRYGQTSLNMKDMEILRYITTETSRAEINATIDLIVKINDSSGRSIEEEIANRSLKKKSALNIQKAQAEGKVEDNLNFDLKMDAMEGLDCKPVDELVKAEAIAAYSKIEALYGPRFSTLFSETPSIQKISFCKTEKKDRSLYSPLFNTVVLGTDVQGEEGNIVTHELVHAFHGLACFGASIWEEGYAFTVTDILSPVDSDQWYKAQGFMGAETLLNLPFRNYDLDAWDFPDPYFAGYSYFKKVYNDNNDYFKKYNEKYLDIMVKSGDMGVSDSKRLEIAINSTSKNIEAMKPSNWFNSHFALLDAQRLLDLGIGNDNSSNSLYFFSKELIFTSNSFKTESYVARSEGIKSNYTLEFKDPKGNTLIKKEKKDFDPDQIVVQGEDWISYDKSASTLSESAKDYQGLVSLEINLSDYLDGKNIKRYQHFAKLKDTEIKYPIYGLVPGVSTGEIEIEGNGKKVSAKIKNGLFIVEDCDFAKAGSYKITLTSGGPKFIQFINKIDMLGYTTIMGNQKTDGSYSVR